MARKTKEDALRTRQLLIESAIQQFAQRGVTNTTLTDIADAAGVTRGAVYWHFSSKAELFNEMWQQQPPLRELLPHQQWELDNQNPLMGLRKKFITGLQYIAETPDSRRCYRFFITNANSPAICCRKRKSASELALITR